MVLNKELRKRIAQMAHDGGDGHIPSAYSILDMVALLYDEFLSVRPDDPTWGERDYFVLSKGHGCLALYVVLHQHGFLTDTDIAGFCTPAGILGEHPDFTKVPGVEASTGSLGHGLPIAVGLALGNRIQGKDNKLFVLLGDGECHEGTVWEAANVATNLKLGRLCVLVDWNQSAAQLMPEDDLPAKWRAFGWNTDVVDGHDLESLRQAVSAVTFASVGRPHVIIAKTVKGKGVPMLEGHGVWHHRIPNDEELAHIKEVLS